MVTMTERAAWKLHITCVWNDRKYDSFRTNYSFTEISFLSLSVFLVFSSLSFFVSELHSMFFCCQKGLCFPRQSVLCQCGLACMMQEGRNLRVFSSVQREISADSRSRLLCVVEILRPCVLTFEVGFGSPHFIITIKMSIRKQNLEMNQVLEIPSGHKHADRTRTSLVFFPNRSTRNQMSAE